MERDLHQAYLKSLDFQTSQREQSTEPKIWVMTSGKGGVGKTFISSSLGITLSKLGHTVVIIDLDLSGANVHTSLGNFPANENIRHFFEGDRNLEDLKTKTPFLNLFNIQGFWDSWSPNSLSNAHIERLLLEIKKLKADYVIIDTAGGATEMHHELLKAADEKFIITSPEPTSIEKTYRFTEAYICHSLKINSTPEAYNKLISTLRDYRQGVLDKPFSFRSYLRNATGIHFDFFEDLSSKPIRLIVNSARGQSDSELGYSIKSVCNKYYDLNVDYSGSICFDNAVWQSIRRQEHVFAAQPFTPLAGQFLNLCKLLIDPEELRAVV
ncbi:MAG: P-loop NTPase [Pseudobdellovibrionaceae bacterium]